MNQKALPAPLGPTTLLGTTLVQQAISTSRSSPRKRIILPLHKDPGALLHRMLNAIQPLSYIRPHRHLHPPKPETIIVLQGAILCFVFTALGEIQEVHTLKAGYSAFGFDCEPGIYHTFLALLTDTVLFEVKPGPYEAATDKDFAPWAPPEGSPEAKSYMTSLYNLGKMVTNNLNPLTIETPYA
jgi:cupin fold WbuC family metalloprotein